MQIVFFVWKGRREVLISLIFQTFQNEYWLEIKLEFLWIEKEARSSDIFKFKRSERNCFGNSHDCNPSPVSIKNAGNNFWHLKISKLFSTNSEEQSNWNFVKEKGDKNFATFEFPNFSQRNLIWNQIDVFWNNAFLEFTRLQHPLPKLVDKKCRRDFLTP